MIIDVYAYQSFESGFNGELFVSKNTEPFNKDLINQIEVYNKFLDEINSYCARMFKRRVSSVEFVKEKDYSLALLNDKYIGVVYSFIIKVDFKNN